MSGLVRACDELFGVELWPKQRELLAAVEAGPRIQVFALGRRSGKTLMRALAALHNLLLRPDLDAMVRPGEPRYAICVATNVKQARLLLRAALSVIEANPALAELVESRSEDEIRFIGGRVLAALPCSSRGVRGWAVSLLALDEFAHFVADGEGPAAADRVWEALLPATAQFGDRARIIVSSTPAGSEGLFAQLYALANSGELPGAIAHHATTADTNPTITAEFLAAEQARDPLSFASEYEAAFAGGAAQFFADDLLEAAVGRDHELNPGEASGWLAGLDPGIWLDPFGLAIVGRNTSDPAQLVLGSVRSWPPPKRKPDSAEERRRVQTRVLGEVGDVLARYQVRDAISDGFLGAAVDEELRGRGVWPERVTLTGPMRLEVFTALRSRLQAGTLALYRHDGLLSELSRVRTAYRGGALQVLTPRSASGHFDLAVALALAVWRLDRNGTVGQGAPLTDRFEDAGPWVFGSAHPRRESAADLLNYRF